MTTRLKILLLSALIVAWFAFVTEGTSTLVSEAKSNSANSENNSHSRNTVEAISPHHDKPALASTSSREPELSSQADTIIPKIMPRANLIGHREFSGTKLDLFKPNNWMPPPPPLAAPIASSPVPVSPPVAPSLPFTVIGKKLEGGKWEVFLSQAGQLYVVREEQLIDGIYKVVKIDPPNMELTYLPLMQNQTLAIGNAE